MKEDAIKLIDNQAQLFIKEVESLKEPELMSPVFNEFEIFKPKNFVDLSMSTYLSKRIDGLIRRILIRETIEALLSLYEVDYKKFVDRFNEYALVVNNVAYCKSSASSSINEELKRLTINEIYTVNFNDYDISKEYGWVSFKSFFRECFTSDEGLYGYYYKTISEAINKAYDIIGYSTFRTMKGKNLSMFKEELLKTIKTSSYFGRPLFEYSCESINKEDLKTMNDHFIIQGYYKYMCGESKFAKFFVTSEYLYSIIKANSYFDYASVALGYYKAIEEMVNLLCKQTDTFRTNEVYHECRKKKMKGQEPCLDKCKKCPGIKSNLKSILIEDVPYCCWKVNNISLEQKMNNLRCVRKTDLVSIETQNVIFHALHYFRSNYRNGYVHEDKISSLSTLEEIRDYAWLCIYYLLGAYSIDETIIGKDELIDYNYNKLFRELIKVNPVLKGFICVENGKEYKLIRDDIPEEVYTNDGRIKNELVFYIVDDLEHFTEELTKEQKSQLKKYVIYYDHMPDKLDSFFHSKLNDKIYTITIYDASKQ